MNPSPTTRLPGVLVWVALVCAPIPASAGEFAFFHENVLGTSLELRIEGDTADAASWAEDQVLREIDRLSAVFSTYDPKSEFCRWQATSKVAVTVSPELFEVLQACDEWTGRSGGAFDPRVEALTRLWSRSARWNRRPTEEELAASKALMTRPAWRLDPRARTAEHLSDCPLSLNAIAKGYIIESACKVAFDRGRGIRGIALNIGGDLRVRGDIVQAIAIANPARESEGAEPLSRIEVHDRSVATSGSAQRGVRIGDQWFSHLFDPRTGLPVGAITSATVIADRADVADALATICAVVPVSEALRLAGSIPGVDCLLVAADGRTLRSDGWPPEVKPSVPHATLADAGTAAVSSLSRAETRQAKEPKPAPDLVWNDEFELLVSFEIQGPGGTSGRYRRPFVAVWIEDKEGTSVRTLVLWAQKNARSQWVPDLRRWYRGDQARRLVDDLDLRKMLSRATRPPGKYDVVWDGKDDHGRSVAAGEYSVNIEAVREHGTYQSIRKRVTLADRPFVEDLKGNVEIKSAALSYRRKGPPR